MLIHVVSKSRPVLAPMHGAHSNSLINYMTAFDDSRACDLQCCVRVAQNDLAQQAQTVLNVRRRSCSVDHKTNANNIETVELVNHRDSEGAIVGVTGLNVDETVAFRKDGAPFVVRSEGKVRFA